MRRDSTLLYPRENSHPGAPERMLQNVPNNIIYKCKPQLNSCSLGEGCAWHADVHADVDVYTCVSVHVEAWGHPQMLFLRSCSPCFWNRLSPWPGTCQATYTGWPVSPRRPVSASQGRTCMWALPCPVYFCMGSGSPTGVLMLTKWVSSPPGPQCSSKGKMDK